MENLIGRAKMGMIVGKWGQYKTFLSLDMAVALAGQSPWPVLVDENCKHFDVPKALRVLYLAAEGGAAEYHQRIEAALQNRRKIDCELVSGNFVLAAASAPLDTTTGQHAIVDVIERATKQMGGSPEVIFCDTLAKSMAGEENSNTDMGKVQRAAAAIQRCLDCTFIFVHHTGKSDDKSGRGASSMPAGLDFLLHVSGDEATKVAVVNVEKQKEAKAEKNIVLQGRIVCKSLAFSRITEKLRSSSGVDEKFLIYRLSKIIEEGRGVKFTVAALARVLAKETHDDFEGLSKKMQESKSEKFRGQIRRHVIDAETTNAEEFHERFRIGSGSNAKWTQKDADSA
jgi:hypothetical protein